ncbi:MAG TPA: IS1634 family transposase [Rectinema sp.]|nr:IS1634 family transposase [Rectinema sp.]HOO02432.1 IS1634 family transposase [Rectinema sp.]HOR92062.1 IS1634 family transposase [Rectinema sp.]HRU78145.1 IS1634 family transposase [Rectinema sp.]
MNIRTTTSVQGSKTYHYVQLVQSVRDEKTGKPKTIVLYNFGKPEDVDLDAVRKLIAALSTLLPHGELVLRPSVGSATGDDSLGFLEARDFGGIWLLDALWKRLGIHRAVEGLLDDRAYTSPVERLMFAMVSSRILSPGSKLSIEHWVEKNAYIPGLPSVDVHQLYRAMDLLVDSSEQFQHAIFQQVAKTIDLDVDLLFLDTTNTFFEIDYEDLGEEGLRKRGQSKDNHPELPLISIAFAVTRGGIPVRCWVFPGNTSDQNIVEEVKRDLGTWNLGNIIMVEDAGFNSSDNRRILRRCAGHYIIGEKLRTGSSGVAVEALHRKGRYKTLKNGLSIKDVITDEGTAAMRRYIVVRNPESAARDKKIRDDIVAVTRQKLDELTQLSGEAHSKHACMLRSHSAYGRYIRQDEHGRLFLNTEKIASEELLDGKFLISTSDMTLPAEDVVAGYKQLSDVERVFRDMKNILDLRPVYHRLEERIRAHVLLCWLAMVLVRYAENESGLTWHKIIGMIDSIRLGKIGSKAGTFWYTTALSDDSKALFKTLAVKEPPKLWALAPGE